MIVYIEKPFTTMADNLVHNQESDQIVSDYDPKFAETFDMEHVIQVLDHMTNHNLYLKNGRGMVFDTPKIRNIVKNMYQEYQETEKLSYDLRLLTREYQLRSVVYFHLTGRIPEIN